MATRSKKIEAAVQNALPKMSTDDALRAMDNAVRNNGAMAASFVGIVLKNEKAGPDGLDEPTVERLAVHYVQDIRKIPEPAEGEKKSSSYGTLVSEWKKRLRIAHVLPEFIAEHEAQQKKVGGSEGCGWAPLSKYGTAWLNAKRKVAPRKIVAQAFADRATIAAAREEGTPLEVLGWALHDVLARKTCPLAFQIECGKLAAKHGINVKPAPGRKAK